MTKVEELRQLARVIKNETAVGGNTAERVGSAFEGVADAIEGIEQIKEMEKAVDAVKEKLNASKQAIEEAVSSLPIAQEAGDSATKVMSQKAVTEAIEFAVVGPKKNIHLQEKYTYNGMYLSEGYPSTATEDEFIVYVYELSGMSGKLKIDRNGIYNQNDAYALVEGQKVTQFKGITVERTEIEIKDVDYILVAGYKKTYNVVFYGTTEEKELEGIIYQKSTTNHPLKDIRKHNARKEWVNDFRVSEVKGVEFYCHNLDQIVISVKNIKTNSVREVSRFVAFQGINTNLFEEKLTLSDEERLGLYGVCNGVKAVDEKGIGMYEGTLFHHEWEIAYNIITDVQKVTIAQLVRDVEFLKKSASNAYGKIAVRGSWQSLGTSITWYNDNINKMFTAGYQARVQEYVVFDKFVNSGVNGGVLSSAISQVQRADYYTVEHGVNDWGHSTPVGTIEDYLSNANNGTFAAIYRKLIDTIYSKNSTAKIILCTPRRAYGFNGYLPNDSLSEKNGIRLSDYADIIKKIAAIESLPVCDWFYESGCNQRNLADLSIDVALHPNDRGYEQMAKVLIETFKKVI